MIISFFTLSSFFHPGPINEIGFLHKSFLLISFLFIWENSKVEKWLSSFWHSTHTHMKLERGGGNSNQKLKSWIIMMAKWKQSLLPVCVFFLCKKCTGHHYSFTMNFQIMQIRCKIQSQYPNCDVLSAQEIQIEFLPKNYIISIAFLSGKNVW